jgi:phenylalanyl-tRNA synthetase beta chain
VVLLEAAYFKPQSIGKTSRELGLISESSIRFERGVDPNAVAFAADRAAQLMQELAGGVVLKGSIDVYPKPFKLKKITLRPSRANQILGTNLDDRKMANILRSLELEVGVDFSSQASQNDSCIEVGVPTFRPDLEREIDLIEEIGRLNGLNNIQSTLPKGSSQVGRATEMDGLSQQLRNLLAGYGLKEAINYSFIDPSWLKKLPKNQQNAAALKNPLSADHSVLRTSLLPGLLQSLLYNAARQQENVQLFEIGKIFKAVAQRLPEEENHLGLILSGSFSKNTWYSKEKAIDFYDAKGIIQSILKNLRVSTSLIFEPFQHELFFPQRSFVLGLGEEKLGVVAELHPKFTAEYNLKTTVYAELNLALFLKYSEGKASFKGISDYPAINLDVALLVDKKIKHSEVVRSTKEKGHTLLSKVRLFDIYEGKGVEEGKKSMAYSLTYQSMECTLELAEVQKIHNQILENLKKDLGATIR